MDDAQRQQATPASPEQEPRKAGGRRQTFEALRHPGYRLLWAGLLVSSVGTWLQIVSLSLLVLQVARGSALTLGLVSLAQAAAFFAFALPAGAAADRFDKRRILFVTQTLLALIAAGFGTLALTRHATIPLLLLLAFASSAVLSFDQPARSALVPLLVPKESLMNAVSLQSVAFNAASAFGPALAGLLAGLIGLAGNFYLNAASYVAVIGVLVFIHPRQQKQPGPDQKPAERPNLWASVREALVVVARDRALPWVMLGYGALLFFGPSVSLIFPVFAQRVLHLQSGGLGLLFAASGVGTVLGGLLTASLGDFRHKGPLFLGGIGLWLASLVVFALSRSLWLTGGALVFFGIGLNIASATAITLMQTRVAQEMRGRVMSLNTLLMMGVRPLGDFPAGALVGVIGAPGVVLVGAGLAGVIGLFLGTRKGLREV